MSMTTQIGRPRIQPLDDYEFHEPAAAGGAGSRPPGDEPDPERHTDIQTLLTGIPSQRTGSRPREEISKRQVERILGGLLEVHSGLRAVTQLRPWLSPELAMRILDDTPWNRPRYQLRSTHLCLLSDDSFEVAATALARSRTVAVTARFEHRSRQWRCTQFAVLDPRAS